MYLAMSAKTYSLAPPFPLHVALRKVHGGDPVVKGGHQNFSETFQHQRCGRGPVDRVHKLSPKRCQYGHRWGILFRVGVRSLLATAESLDNVHEPENKRGVKHRMNVEQSKFYLLTYWILLLARPVFFFFFSPASTLGVWPLTWRV